jgi:predicted methyltransferase
MKKLNWAVAALSAIGLFAAAHAADTKVYDAAVANPARTKEDRERDAREHPAEVMAFAGLKPGMKVADIFAGGGYYSELMSYVVGTKGTVLLVNNQPYEDYATKELKLKEHLAGDRLPNVKHLVVDPKDLQLGKDLDQVWIVMSYHDLFYADAENGWPAIDPDDFVDQIYKSLKPGGVFVIIDHAAKAGAGKSVAKELHRIEESFARSEITRHGFEFAGHYDQLRNPKDDLAKGVFDPAVRFKTDRFVHLYRKPAGG